MRIDPTSLPSQVTASMALSSKHTKHALEDLHENIACMRHPDHSGGQCRAATSRTSAAKCRC